MKIALIQHKFQASRAATREWIIGQIAEAVGEGAQLICLAELHEGEYFCQVEEPGKFDLAASFDEDLAFWAGVARRFRVVLLASLFERRTAGVYHNAALVFERDGTLAGKYRKMHLPQDRLFYEKFYFAPGDLGFEPINTSLGRLGVLICYDQWFVEPARILALKGAQILIYPTAIAWSDEDVAAERARQLEAWLTVQRGHAIANGVFLAAINRTGREGGLDFWGSSFVCGPQGEELGRLGSQEGRLISEINFSRIEEVRRWWPFLRDRRVDSYAELAQRLID